VASLGAAACVAGGGRSFSAFSPFALVNTTELFAVIRPPRRRIIGYGSEIDGKTWVLVPVQVYSLGEPVETAAWVSAPVSLRPSARLARCGWACPSWTIRRTSQGLAIFWARLLEGPPVYSLGTWSTTLFGCPASYVSLISSLFYMTTSGFNRRSGGKKGHCDVSSWFGSENYPCGELHRASLAIGSLRSL